MDHSAVTLEQLKKKTLPELFATPTKIGEYGNTLNAHANIEHLSNLMETGAATQLAKTVGEILSRMADASPERIAQKPGWFARVTGRALESQLRYQVARKNLDQLLSEAEGHAQGVRDTVETISRLIASHEHEVGQLEIFIQAGREFLQENPNAGAISSSELEFDRPRERMARKLANLATLLASHEVSINQMKLTRAQAVDMLDRFNETVRVLVPVWRQHTLALITTKNMSPNLVAQASKAHSALMSSLSQSIDGLTKH